MDTLLTVKQVAERLNVAPKTVRKWRQMGKIPATMLPGGMLRFSERVVNAWVEKRTVKARTYIAADSE